MSGCGLIFLFLFLKQVDDEKSQNSMTIMRMISKSRKHDSPTPTTAEAAATCKLSATHCRSDPALLKATWSFDIVFNAVNCTMQN